MDERADGVDGGGYRMRWEEELEPNWVLGHYDTAAGCVKCTVPELVVRESERSECNTITFTLRRDARAVTGSQAWSDLSTAVVFPQGLLRRHLRIAGIPDEEHGRLTLAILFPEQATMRLDEQQRLVPPGLDELMTDNAVYVNLRDMMNAAVESAGDRAKSHQVVQTTIYQCFGPGDDNVCKAWVALAWEARVWNLGDGHTVREVIGGVTKLEIVDIAYRWRAPVMSHKRRVWWPAEGLEQTRFFERHPAESQRLIDIREAADYVPVDDSGDEGIVDSHPIPFIIDFSDDDDADEGLDDAAPADGAEAASDDGEEEDDDSRARVSLYSREPLKLSEYDIETLRPGRFVTDMVLSMAISQHPKLRNNSRELRDVYVFNSFFMEKLGQDNGKGSDEANLRHTFAEGFYQWGTCKSMARPGPDGTRPAPEPALFDKDFILIPVNNSDMHWLLYLVYRPFSGKATDGPLVYVIDSKRHFLELYHGAIVELLATYFDLYSIQYRGVGIDRAGIIRRGFVIPRVPQQLNGSDCGFFCVLFIHTLLDSRKTRRDVLRNYTKERILTQVTPWCAARMRAILGEYYNKKNIDV